jgi:hypothetical protein
MKRFLLALVLAVPMVVSSLDMPQAPDLTQEHAPIPMCLPCPDDGQ